MVNKKFIAVDNYDEFIGIEVNQPYLKDAELILLSGTFNLDQLKSLEGKSFSYFDDYIDNSLSKVIADKVHQILWNWYKDKNGNDISMIEGFSLGLTFCGSMEILLNSIIKYELGLARIFKEGDEVYCLSSVEPIFKTVVNEISKISGFRINYLNVQVNSKVVVFGKDKIKLDLGGRYRDLSATFKVKHICKATVFLIRIIRKFFSKIDLNSGVLLFPAGKLDDFIEEKRATTDLAKLHWILPFSFKGDLLKILSNRYNLCSRYLFSISHKNASRSIERIMRKLECNILVKEEGILGRILVSLINKYIFNFVPQAFSYYNNVLSELTYLKPKLTIICAEGSEPQFIVAQASRRLGIEVAILPHGIDDWMFKEIRTGKDKIIDYFFAFGNKHVLDNQFLGMNPEQVIITSHPYFLRFLPIIKNNPSIYKKVLILTPEFINVSPGVKYRYFFDYLYGLVTLMRELGIEVLGIKSRGVHVYELHNIKGDFLDIDGKKYPLFSGYTSFPEIAENADLIIGGSSTALIESGLMGKDFYVTYPESDLLSHSLSPVLEKMMYVSHSVDELRENILNRRIFRQGYSTEDFVDLKGLKTKIDLYNRFELAIFNTVRLNLKEGCI